jgi:hypothetical protein
LAGDEQEREKEKKKTVAGAELYIGKGDGSGCQCLRRLAHAASSALQHTREAPRTASVSAGEPRRREEKTETARLL